MLLLLFILLNNGKIQNRIADVITNQFSEKIGSRVEVGKIRYKLFNTFTMSGFYVEDLHKDTLLFIDKADADFDFWKMLKGKVEFHSVNIDQLKAKLSVDTAGVSNLEFVIKALKPKKKKEPSNILFHFRDIKINHSNISFANYKHLPQKNPKLFDANRIQLTDFNAHIGIDYLKNDSLIANIKSLSAKEKSGLELKNLQTQLFGLKKGVWMPKVDLLLSDSKISLDSVRMSYDSIRNFNDFANKVKLHAKLNQSSVMLDDLSPFASNFKNIHKPIWIKGEFKGFLSSFSVKKLELKYGNSLLFQSDIDINGIADIDETFVYADVHKFQVNKNEAQDLVAKLMNRPFILPKELNQLGTVKYNGNISGFFSNLVAYGNINTNVGNLKTDILLQFENKLRDLRYNGTIRTNNFQLGRLLASKELGKTTFSLTTKGTKLYKKPLQGTIKGNIAAIDLHQYNYQKITLDGSYDGSGFDGKVDIDDHNLQANFNGVVDLSKKLPVLNFDLEVAHADINALKLTNKYQGSQLSFSGNTNMIGNSLDNLNGFLALNNVTFKNKEKILEFENLMFESEVGANNSRFTISSDVIDGIFEGDFNYSTLPITVKKLISNYIPSLSGNKNTPIANNFMNIDISLSDTKKISEVLELPFTIDGNSSIKGYIDDRNNQIELKALAPFVSFGNKKIQDIDLIVNNVDKKLNILAKAGFFFKKDLVNLNIKANAANDSLYTQVGWQNSNEVNYAGELQTITEFKNIKNFTTAQINVLPTQMIIQDTIWDLKPSQITFNQDTTFTVNNFRLQNDNQYITLNGTASKSEVDGLEVGMNDLQVNYFLDLFNFNSLSIAGKATGSAKIFSLLKKPIFEADFKLRETKLNDAKIGDGIIRSTWNREKERLEANGMFFNDKGKQNLFAEGVYVPKRDSLDFTFDATKVNLGFLQRYLSSVVSNVKGVGTGKVRMSGRTKNIGFEGNVFAENAKATVDYTKTTYSFSDTIKLTRKSISFDKIKIYDDDKNSGILSGVVNHNGMFKNMNFDAKVTTKNLMALNTSVVDNDFFYGKAYASGDVHIYGTETDIYFDINVASRPKTKFYLSVGSAETANENNFITFISHSQNTTDTAKPKIIEKSDSKVYLNMEIDVNPDAEIQLVIDPKGGDKITATGNGNLRLTYDDNNDMKLYGGYTLDKGDYLFTFQNILRKEFSIEQGSSILWSGDPFHGKLDIRALYTLTASLRDLMDEVSLKSYTSRPSVPVSVVLNITDDLLNPAIAFDIDLPSSDETLKYQVKSLINTQEMLNRQVAFLLLTNKFYMPEYTKTSDSYTSNLLSSTLSPFISTTLLGQLNNVLSQVVGNLSFGVNIRDTGNSAVKSTEYEGQVFYQPNNKLIINGNFGYRNDNLSKNKFIGDVDIEYILTKNGKFRMKGYNHTIDRYTLHSAQFIQGAGVLYKETFNSWDELIKQYWNKRNKKKDETHNNSSDSVK